MKAEDGRRVYVELSEYAAVHTKVLSTMLEPLTTIIDRYGELICQVTLILGKTPPASARDAAIRDLMADVFDFLMETRPLISKGKVAIAYPLARRAYESLSLMVACHLDKSLAKRWIAGKQIGNAEVRRVLGKHPLGEPQEQTPELYNFFSKTTHPNRDQIAQRFLGEGNEFVLGAIGRPSLAMLSDYGIKLLNLWFWFGAFICFIYDHEPGRALTMKFIDMSDIVFRSTGEVWKSTKYLPVARKEGLLGHRGELLRSNHVGLDHRRHGQHVIQVVDRELKNNASLVQTLSLPVTSLLAMIVSPVAKQPDYIDPIELEQPASAQAATDTHTIVAQPVVFAIDPGTRKVIFRGGPELKGAGYGLVCALAAEFEEDIESGITKDSFRYIKADELAKRLGIDEQSLRQRVSRTRKVLEQQFLNICNIQLDPEDVVQNEEWKGYRLNPYLLLVKPTQLHGVGPMSQLNSSAVTTPPQPR